MTDVKIECEVTEIEEVTAEIRILTLSPMSGPLFPWRAGQYAAITGPDGRAREFSIANAPSTDTLQLHIRRSGRGGLSDFLCDNVAVGDRLQVAGGMGAAYYRDRHEGPMLAIAGGTGLAPMKAIVEAALHSGFAHDIHLYAGFVEDADIYLERHFINLMRSHSNFRYVCVVENPDVGSGRRRGRVTDAISADFQLLYGHQVYLAGPPAMVEACVPVLKLKSVPPHDMFSDALF